jgi:hypothetical protein
MSVEGEDATTIDIARSHDNPSSYYVIKIYSRLHRALTPALP